MESHRISPPPVVAKDIKQTISFKGSDSNYSVQILAQDVTVNCSSGNHNHGSSKVKLTNVVDYNWEQKYYTGQIIAVHISGKYIAYGIKGKGGGMVRVTTHNSRMRALIKDMNGQVQDIAFAHIFNSVILGCVDAEGSLFVYNIEDNGDSLNCTLQLHIVQNDDVILDPNVNRVIWCPFLPEDDDTEDDTGKLLVLTHNFKAELLNIAVITSKHGVGPINVSEIADGYIELNAHKQAITDASFSPDGTAIATASLDGFVKFFQIYMHSGSVQRCLHEWPPHNGKPLSSIHFLDSHNLASPDENFWKFLLTCSDNNTELKMWSCQTWSCLQTITFVPNPSSPIRELYLQARLDITAEYLLLSDINNRVLYILEMHKDEKGMIEETSNQHAVDENTDVCSNDERVDEPVDDSVDTNNGPVRLLNISNNIGLGESQNDSEDAIKLPPGGTAFARSISEFLLPAPVLSFGIVEASLRKFRCSNSTEELYPCEDNDDFEQSELDEIVAIVVRMYVIQPKRLQECQIVFQPESCKPSSNSVSPINEQHSFPEILPVIPNEKITEILEKNADLATATSEEMVNQLSQLLQNDLPKLQNFSDIQNLLIQPSQSLNLMTPDAFNSPVKNEHPEANPTKSSPSPLPDNRVSRDSEILNFQQRNQKDNFASGGSSPSREVQEILSLNNSNYEYYENDKNSEDTNILTSQETDYDGSSVIYNETTNLNADGWPSIPILKAKAVLNSEEKNNIGRLVLQDSNERLIERNLGIPDGQLSEPLNNHKDIDNSDIRDLHKWMLTLMQLVREQASHLEKLQNELKNLKLNQEKCNVPENIENIIANQLDLALARSHAQQTKMFDNWANSRLTQDREHQEAVALNLSHVVCQQFHEKFETTLSSEIKRSILPFIVTTFENLKQKLRTDFVQKLTETQQMLLEKLTSFISSQAIADSVGKSVSSTMRPTLEKSYQDVITNKLIPSLDKICCNMFTKLNETFLQGTKEYTQALELHLDKTQRKIQDKNEKTIAQLQGLSEVMRGSNDNISINLPLEINRQIMVSFQKLQQELISNMSELIKEQVSVSFKDQASVLEDSVINAVRSRAVTPSPNDTQLQLAQIQSLLTQGHVNTAFQQALSASDLSLVVYICEKLNPQAIFGQIPCPLQQHVLLSLIQQLSADMHNHTELKTKYLENAVLNLDPSNLNTKTHMIPVLKELHRQLSMFISACPTHKCIVQMKMLIMAVKSLLKI